MFILVLYFFLFLSFQDHESIPAVIDNEDNLLGNVSSCIESLNIKQDYRVDNLQGQDNKQSRKRQIEANTSGEEISGIYAPILFIHLILSFVQWMCKLSDTMDCSIYVKARPNWYYGLYFLLCAAVNGIRVTICRRMSAKGNCLLLFSNAMNLQSFALCWFR